MSEEDEPGLEGMGIVRKRRSRRILEHRTTTSSEKSQGQSAAASAWGEHLSSGAFEESPLPESTPAPHAPMPAAEVPASEVLASTSSEDKAIQPPAGSPRKVLYMAFGLLLVVAAGLVVLLTR